MRAPAQKIHRRRFALSVAMAAACVAVPALHAQPRLEKNRISVVVGGKSNFLHLPLTLADQLGYFRSEGLAVDMQEAGSSRRALELQLEGRADVCAGHFESTLLLQARGLTHQAFVLQSRTPQAALGVSLRYLPAYRSVADLKGKRIGVSERGSGAGLMARVVLARAGLAPDDVQWVEVEAGAAVAALRAGQLDALAQYEPVMSTLEQRAEVRIIFDTRTLKGTADVFGGPMPASCLHAHSEFVQRHPNTCQALTNGIVHALKWLQTAGPGDMIKTVPEAYFLGDRAMYLAAFNKVREAISPDGLMPPEAARNVARVLFQADPALKLEKMDVERAYTNEFARRAKDRYRA
jgi:NitT/TauT family transport system substrate-binding protein